MKTFWIVVGALSKDGLSKGALLSGALLLAGCTTEQMYYSTQHWQRNECRKVRSGDDRTRCESRPQLSFEQYEAERNKPRSK